LTPQGYKNDDKWKKTQTRSLQLDGRRLSEIAGEYNRQQRTVKHGERQVGRRTTLVAQIKK